MSVSGVVFLLGELVRVDQDGPGRFRCSPWMADVLCPARPMAIMPSIGPMQRGVGVPGNDSAAIPGFMPR